MGKPPCTAIRKTLEAIYSETAEWTRPLEPRPENKVMLLRFDRSMVT